MAAHAGYVVTLAADVPAEDAEAIVNALRMVKGVAGVDPIVGGDAAGHIAQMRAHQQWRDALVNLIHDGVGSQ